MSYAVDRIRYPGGLMGLGADAPASTDTSSKSGGGFTDIINEAIALAKSWANFTNPATHMSYKEFIEARDVRLNELKNFGAHTGTGPAGWTEELTQGFTHDQIKRDYSAWKDYSTQYLEFLKKVYYPILYNINRLEYNRQMAELEAGIVPIPGTKFTIPLRANTARVVDASENKIDNRFKYGLYAAGGLATIGLVIIIARS
jgi:hypothetical protein